MKRAVAARLLPGGERMRFFPSLELSTGDGNTHVLGYGADTENAVLLRTLEEIRRSRLTRMEEMLERLANAGYPSAGGTPGTPAGSRHRTGSSGPGAGGDGARFHRCASV